MLTTITEIGQSVVFLSLVAFFSLALVGVGSINFNKTNVHTK